jgi:UDP-glucose 4-epimerase
MSCNVLVIGGAGYIGSHVCKALAISGYTPIVYDSFVTGHRSFVRFGPHVEADLLNFHDLCKALTTFSPLAVIHLASYSNIRQSITEKELYYRNNLLGTKTLLEALCSHTVPYLLFSSSASIYGKGSLTPLTEESFKLPAMVTCDTSMQQEQTLNLN